MSVYMKLTSNLRCLREEHFLIKITVAAKKFVPFRMYLKRDVLLFSSLTHFFQFKKLFPTFTTSSYSFIPYFPSLRLFF